ncbi:MAG TPA: hypothetical protein EYP22_09420 [Methanosarcinales archaeon]|nr:hypothetical protein [Methanosarcinales archaeon]
MNASYGNKFNSTSFKVKVAEGGTIIDLILSRERKILELSTDKTKYTLGETVALKTLKKIHKLFEEAEYDYDLFINLASKVDASLTNLK